MGYLGQVIWFIPLAMHGGYFLATLPHFTAVLKVAEHASGIARWQFAAGWCAVVGAANLAFLVLMIWLPKMRDTMLQVPGSRYWLSGVEPRRELISRLRGICAAALFGLNIFFLAVYQMIYQSHVARPYLKMSSATLVIFFMIIPLLVSLISMVLTLRSLAVDSREPQ